jgi:2-keto-3-deoxy-L-fuconate dehydrogenase
MRLTNKTALITAAAAGIGRAAAIAFKREGAQVIAVDINAQSLQELGLTHPGIRHEVLDVTDASAIEVRGGFGS